ncbi:DUF6151 family protein [Marinovum algicola]|jgi:hypothetical protein|uniref:DUF6151 family protein n=1 Tax=Marinovum algicola TaxID=42444 RepID=UPI0024BA8A78|nr:DUF6151 family protein [Marinovum algicola]
MNARFACTCGATEWHVSAPRRGTRLICYCADCQSFPRHLGADILNEAGGTDLLQVAPSQVTFTHGIGNLGLLRLSPQGLSRWHTTCCGTPVANTLKSAKLPFVSLSCAAHQGEDKLLGPVRAHANTVWAGGPGAPRKDRGLGRMVLAFCQRLLAERLSGRWQQTPFFAPPDWAPVAEPQILSKQARLRARA